MMMINIMRMVMITTLILLPQCIHAIQEQMKTMLMWNKPNDLLLLFFVLNQTSWQTSKFILQHGKTLW